VSCNIFWTGGFDSTFLVCKRLIIEKKFINTFYLNFPCDGYNKKYNKFYSSNYDKCMVINDNILKKDKWDNKESYGRYSRSIEVSVINKLRELILNKFNSTIISHLFPKIKLIEEFELKEDILKDAKTLANVYKARWYRADQTLYMAQFSLDLNDEIEVAYEADVTNPDGVTYSIATRLIRENLDENLKVKMNAKIPELRIYKNWSLPLHKTYRKEMVKIAKKYDFLDIMEHTWSCRFPKENGDPCDDCNLEVKDLKRINNYKKILGSI
jgi:hypothetical protein